MMTDSALQQLINDLRNGDDRKRRAASYRLGKFKDPAAVAALIAAADDKDDSVRRNVADGLRAIGTQEALDFLAARQSRPVPTAPSHVPAATVSQTIPPDSAVIEVSMKSSFTAAFRKVTVMLDGKMSGNTLVGNLIGTVSAGQVLRFPVMPGRHILQLKDVNWIIGCKVRLIRGQVLRFVTEISDMSGLGLNLNLNSRIAVGYKNAVRLGKEPIPKVNITDLIQRDGMNGVYSLLSIGDDRYAAFRSESLAALGKMKDAAAIPYLLSFLNDEDNSLRDLASASLTAMGEAAVDSLLAAMTDGWYEQRTRFLACEALGRIGAPAVEPVIACLSAENQKGLNSLTAEGQAAEAMDELSVTYLIHALGLAKDPRAVEVLHTTLNVAEMQRSVRHISQVVEALTNIGTPAAPVLASGLGPKLHPHTRYECKKALDAIIQKDTGILQDSKVKAALEAYAQEAAAK